MADASEAELRILQARIGRAPLGELPDREIDQREALRTHDRAVQLLIERSLTPPRQNTIPLWTALGVVAVGLVLEITIVVVALLYLLALVILLLLLQLWQML